MVTPLSKSKQLTIDALYKEVLKKAASPILQTNLLSGVKSILRQALVQQIQYQEMLDNNSRLRAELGVVDSAAAINSVVDTWVNSVSVTVNKPHKVGNQIVGVLVSITAIDASYQDVIEQGYASYDTEKGENIPWLEWLLTKGVELVIFDHIIFKPVHGTDKSRTHTNTIMAKSAGKAWGVPMYAAGTSGNNMASHAAALALPEIKKLLEKQFN